MAKEIELLCLANSRREGGRCVAGIDLETDKWVRLAKSDGNPFSATEISYKNDESPRPLDKIKIRIIKPKVSYFHPENWIVDKRFRWEKIGQDGLKALSQYTDISTPFLFEDPCDCLSAKDLQNNPLPRSLMLIHKKAVIFQKTWSEWRRKPQVRAKFKYRGHEYNLVVTDDEWENIFTTRSGPYWNFGDYPFNGSFHLVVGIGEDYKGRHYKLVVAVITSAKNKMKL